MAAADSLDLGQDQCAIIGTPRGQFPSPAERDRVIREYGADTGMAQTLRRLADHLATLAP